MAEFVWCGGHGDPAAAQVFLEQIVDGARGNPASALADKQRPFVHAGLLAVFLDRLHRGWADRAQPFLFPLAQHAHGVVVRIDVPDVQRHQLRQPQAGRVEQLEDRRIARRRPRRRLLFFLSFRARRRQQRLHLVHGEDDRQLLLGFRQLDGRQRVDRQLFPARQKGIKTAHRGEMQPDRGARQLALHHREKVGPEIVRRRHFPAAETCVPGAIAGQRMTIIGYCAIRGAAFDVQKLQELVHQPVDIRRRRGCAGRGGRGRISGWRLSRRIRTSHDEKTTVLDIA